VFRITEIEFFRHESLLRPAYPQLSYSVSNRQISSQRCTADKGLRLDLPAAEAVAAKTAQTADRRQRRNKHCPHVPDSHFHNAAADSLYDAATGGNVAQDHALPDAVCGSQAQREYATLALKKIT
jgi:hypothetical protein